MICGLILAGGRSTRFGREKAMATLQDRPLIGWVADALSGQVDRLAVSARAGSGTETYAHKQGWPVVHDAAGEAGRAPMDGPLAGVLAGLRWASDQGGRWLCTAPCDTPFLPMDLVSKLFSGAGGQGAVARTTDGLQPLAALWPVEARETVERWGGAPAPRDVLASLGARPVNFAGADAFANLNTPAEYAAARCAAARSVR